VQTDACSPPMGATPRPPRGKLPRQPSVCPTPSSITGCTPLLGGNRRRTLSLFANLARARRTRKTVLPTVRKRLLIFSIMLAAVEVGTIDKGDLIPGGGHLGKICLHLCWGLSWQALHKISTQRYLQRERGRVPKTDGSFKWVFYSASEMQFRTAFRVNRSTFQALKSILLLRALAASCRRRGGASSAWTCSSLLTYSASATTRARAQ